MWGFIGVLLPFLLPWRAWRTRRPRGQRDWPSLASLKSISWQLAGGKPAIGNHQVPDHFTHIFQKPFLNLLSASSPWFSNGLSPLEQLLWCTAPQLWKSPPSPEWLSLWPPRATRLSTEPLSNSKHARPATLTSVLPCTFPAFTAHEVLIMHD